MIVACYDADMCKYIRTPFNIDLMKLSAYYKKKRDIVTMAPVLDANKYSKILYRKDYYDGTFDSEILSNPKIEYGGRAFSQELYLPMPLDIELMKPDTFIYDPMRRIFCVNKAAEDLYNQMNRAQHIRLSLDGTTIWPEWERQLNRDKSKITFIFHDYNLNNIEDIAYVMKSLNKIFPSKRRKFIGTKFPIASSNEESLMRWTNYSPMRNFYGVEMLGPRSDEFIYEFYKHTQGTSTMAQSRYNLTANYTNDEDFANKLPQIYKQIVFLRNHKIGISLIYDENVFEDKRWGKVLSLIKHYHYQATRGMNLDEFERITPYDSLFSLVRAFSEVETYKFHFKTTENPLLTKGEARQVFRFVQENCYELFKDFYECHDIIFKGGRFKYV